MNSPKSTIGADDFPPPPERIFIEGFGWIQEPTKPKPNAHPSELLAYNEDKIRWTQALRKSTWGFAKLDRVRRIASSNRSRYSNNRRARMKNQFVEDVDANVVYERDGWICQLCLHPVSKIADKRIVDVASLDHIIPLSKGGEHSYKNTQLAHLSCNVRKGNRT